MKTKKVHENLTVSFDSESNCPVSIISRWSSVLYLTEEEANFLRTALDELLDSTVTTQEIDAVKPPSDQL